MTFWLCLFQEKDSDEERKVGERNTFHCLELSKKVKERKNICGTHLRNLSPHIWMESMRKHVFCLKCLKCPNFYCLFLIHFTTLVGVSLLFFQFTPNFFLSNSPFKFLLVSRHTWFDCCMTYFILPLKYIQCLYILTYYFCLRVIMSILKYRSFFPLTFYSTFPCTKQPKQSSHFLLFFFP